MTLVAIAVLILVTDQLANFFKYGVQRLRPCHDNEINGLMRLVKVPVVENSAIFLPMPPIPLP